MIRECANCSHSKGWGSDIYCGIGHTEYESCMTETDCPWFELLVINKGVKK